MRDLWQRKQCNTNEALNNIKRNLNDFYTTTWQDKVHNSAKCVNYRIFKRELSFEKYLDYLPYKFRIAVTRFRLSNHRLAIEVGRHLNVNREERKCFACEIIGDEYHALFECILFHESRVELLDRKYNMGRVNVIRYHKLFNSNNQRVIYLSW